jgi:hypothetical protein
MKKYIIPNSGNLHIHVLHFIMGASLAMEATSSCRLNVLFCNEERISFTTDSANFVSYLRDYLKKTYNLSING